MKNHPKVSLLVLNYNGATITPIILESIKKLHYPKDKIETIVIDNASTDNSIELFTKQYPFVKIVKMSENIAYGAFNKALPHCTGEFCFFLNNDIEFDPDCIQELINIFVEHPDAVIAAPAIYNMQTRKLMYTRKYISRTFYQGADHYENLTEEKNLCATEEAYTGVPLLKTSFAKSLEYIFDPDYFLFVEDIDLAYRIRMLGHMFYRAPKARLYHQPSSTTNLFFTSTRLNYLVERNIIQTYLKDIETKNLILWSPFFCIPRFLKIMIYGVTFKWTLLKSTLSAWGWNITHFKRTFQKRRRVQQLRTVSDKKIFKSMGNEKKVLQYLFTKARGIKPNYSTNSSS
ncbi:TPA: glycosyltransferase [Candidatus Woesearchaeota archaeon]|nr:glycosyltransferase [Candidatus Woesearchaeota archaeon]